MNIFKTFSSLYILKLNVNSITIYFHRLGSNHFPAGLSSTATRSLPDLPVDPERSQLAPGTISSDVLWERGEQNNSGGDTGSELYATVGDNKNGECAIILNRRI